MKGRAETEQKNARQSQGITAGPGDSYGDETTLARAQGEAELHKPFVWHIPLSIVLRGTNAWQSIEFEFHSGPDTVLGVEQQSHPKRQPGNSQTAYKYATESVEWRRLGL